MRWLLSGPALLLVAVLAGPAWARQVNLPSGNPIAGVDIPGDWKTSATRRGVEVRSPDEEVFFWIEVYLPADQAAVSGEHERYFAKQGVKVTGEPTISRSEEGGVKVQATAFPATWKGDPTVLRYLAINPGLPSGNLVLISYWASPDGDKAHDAAFGKILRSLGPPK
ncbi:hypothetical protein [Enterovirga rhinocerotis]|uniref:Serine/threonine protein kinase n=1 Tax=Enterovirga rhinocerotis TaxID=1339210 RepID=A0A4R7C9W9_9HYPH|nr:hypothetical protein [Enterovirga rhinocerotis]TDR94852.1 hypothetical protein EV668_2143 [Enterovirga rhinocerotis]